MLLFEALAECQAMQRKTRALLKSGEVNELRDMLRERKSETPSQLTKGVRDADEKIVEFLTSNKRRQMTFLRSVDKKSRLTCIWEAMIFLKFSESMLTMLLSFDADNEFQPDEFVGKAGISFCRVAWAEIDIWPIDEESPFDAE